jgi:hypothetical protein
MIINKRFFNEHFVFLSFCTVIILNNDNWKKIFQYYNEKFEYGYLKIC